MKEENNSVVTMGVVEVLKGKDLGEEGLLDDSIPGRNVLELLEGGLLTEADAPPLVGGDRGGWVMILVGGCNLPDVGLAENMRELPGCQGIDLVIWGACDEVADAGEFEGFLSMLGENVCPDGMKSVHACSGDLAIACIEEHDGVAVLVQGGCDLACPGISSGKENSIRTPAGDTERKGEGPGNKAIKENSAHDDQEDSRNHLLSLMGNSGIDDALLSSMIEFDGEHGCDSGGYNPAGGECCEKSPFAVVDVTGAETGKIDGGGTDDEDQGSEKGEAGESNGGEISGIDPAGEENEKKGNDEHAEVFLELKDVTNRDRFLVGEGYSEDCYGQES